MISSSTSLVFALALFLTIVVSPTLASSAAERAAAASCGNPAALSFIGENLRLQYRGAVSYPSAFSFSSVRWFPFTPNCNVSVNTPAPAPAGTSVVGYSLSIPNVAGSDINPFFRGIGYDSFQLTSFFNVLPITQVGEISLRIGNESLGQNNGNPPKMDNLINNSINNRTINYNLLSTPIVQFKNGVVVGLSLNIVYPRLPDRFSDLNARLGQTGYDQYYTLVVEGTTWIISEFATGNVRASGFFDSVPCGNIIPGNPTLPVCANIPPIP